MPYSIHKRGDKWVVVNAQTGDVKGRHETREKAVKQQRLLYMEEHGGKLRGS